MSFFGGNHNIVPMCSQEQLEEAAALGTGCCAGVRTLDPGWVMGTKLHHLLARDPPL